jgi:hypothetical protein
VVQGDGQGNRRLLLISSWAQTMGHSSGHSWRSLYSARSKCGRKRSAPTKQTARLVQLSGEGDCLNAGRLFRRQESSRNCLSPVYLQVCGEVAERLKAAVC